jgi:hypothetical protein
MPAPILITFTSKSSLTLKKPLPPKGESIEFDLPYPVLEIVLTEFPYYIFNTNIAKDRCHNSVEIQGTQK